jgi:tetratricopeptide (TPR) repeat protein
LADELKASTARALLALCLFKAENAEGARAGLEQALSQEPDSALLQSVNAYILLKTGRVEDAGSALRLATRTEVPRLALFDRARVCAQMSDSVCQEMSWRELLNLDEPPLSAMVGIAALVTKKEEAQSGRDGVLDNSSKNKKGERESARKLVEKALAISPNFRPALTLRKNVN